MKNAVIAVALVAIGWVLLAAAPVSACDHEVPAPASLPSWDTDTDTTDGDRTQTYTYTNTQDRTVNVWVNGSCVEQLPPNGSFSYAVGSGIFSVQIHYSGGCPDS